MMRRFVLTGMTFALAFASSVAAHDVNTVRISEGAGTLPPENFVLRNARVVSQSGKNTAVVIVSSMTNFPASSGPVRHAAFHWCGRMAHVSLVFTNRMKFSTHRSYVVKCS